MIMVHQGTLGPAAIFVMTETTTARYIPMVEASTSRYIPMVEASTRRSRVPRQRMVLVPQFVTCFWEIQYIQTKKNEYISSNAFTYIQTLKTKNGYIVKYTNKCCKLFLLYLLKTCTVFTIMSLIFCGIPVKC